jgi:hypothetical protein
MSSADNSFGYVAACHVSEHVQPTGLPLQFGALSAV